MARVALGEVQGWLEPTKLTLTSLDTGLLNNLEEEVLARLGSVYDTSLWIDSSTTPKLVRTIISKLYSSWHYDRQYSEDQEEGNNYAHRLAQNAENLIRSIVAGQIIIPDEPISNPHQANFFPTNESSSKKPTELNPEFGGPYFSLGRRF
jgi:hypothetical protein